MTDRMSSARSRPTVQRCLTDLRTSQTAAVSHTRVGICDHLCVFKVFQSGGPPELLVAILAHTSRSTVHNFSLIELHKLNVVQVFSLHDVKVQTTQLATVICPLALSVSWYQMHSGKGWWEYLNSAAIQVFDACGGRPATNRYNLQIVGFETIWTI